VLDGAPRRSGRIHSPSRLVVETVRVQRGVSASRHRGAPCAFRRLPGLALLRVARYPPACPRPQQEPSAMPAARIPSPLKWHAGKSPLAARIVGLMPDHLHYVEPFAGGLSVLLAKPPEGVSEVVNDLEGSLTNFWRVLQQEETFARFARLVQAMPFSEREWNDTGDHLGDPDPVLGAAAFFVRCRQSLAGRRDTFAPITRNRLR